MDERWTPTELECRRGTIAVARYSKAPVGGDLILGAFASCADAGIRN